MQVRSKINKVGCAVFCTIFFVSANISAQQVSNSTYASGSVPVRSDTSAPISLTLGRAIEIALKQNLAPIESTQNHSISRGQKLVALSQLLPSIDGSISEHVKQSSLALYGITLPGISTISGPFQYQDARFSYAQMLFSASSIQALRSTKQAEEAASMSIADAQEAVVLVTGAAYLAAVQADSHVHASTVQVEYAEALHTQAVNALHAGTGTRIDEIRTAVQLDTERYNLLAAKNSLAIAKITLTRVIGLQPGQKFDIADKHFSTVQAVSPLEEMLAEAYRQRADLASAKRTLRAAELSLSEAKGQRLPEITTQADYGSLGTTLGHSHGTFDFAVGVNFPIFTSGRIKGQIDQATATVAKRKAELKNLRAQVEADVRIAGLNLNASNDQVKVAQHNVVLATDNLARARDRFQNGVTDSVEVVQAQQSLAAANDQLISSTYALNLARLNLARATGSARTDWRLVLGGEQ
jgi:outer membrane protein TolC